ncbi:MAG: LysM peptidoglycan-binding domain-containing protein [Chloroflexi bacterium]|nr:LysM peptidoglycan-binding domain-containing protein [Chloroflexota bacterium]
MDISGELSKAVIFVLDGAMTGQTVECMFRPKEYSITKQNSWQTNEAKGKSAPQLEFRGGQASNLTMELFFDTYEAGEDVRKHTSRVMKLMSIDPMLTDQTTAKGRPPMCRFQWGPVIAFKAVLTDITQKFTMFKSDGTPVRATLEVTFKEVEEIDKFPAQNPTTMSMRGYKLRTVREGETLDYIAFEEYGNPALWRHIANINSLDNPLNISPGQIISIAPSP